MSPVRLLPLTRGKDVSATHYWVCLSCNEIWKWTEEDARKYYG